MSTKQQKEEEVDLGSLFQIIGKGFVKLFNFIGSILKEVFHILILTLIFIRSHLLKFVIAAVLGGGAGLYLELNTDTKYESVMLLKPNFNSTRQLYNNISYYNDLIKQKDTFLLKKTFNISIEESISLKKFEITPIRNENDIITLYDDLILEVDTLTAKSYSFDLFKKSFTEFDYKTHKISVQSTNNKIFPKLENTIISSIVENEYYKKQKALNNESLNRTDSILRKDLIQVDSLRNVYMRVMLEEAKKTSQGTRIDLGGQIKTTKEIELFKTNSEINKNIIDISEEKAEKSEILNVISNFQPVGYKVGGLENNLIFLFASFGVILVLIFLLLKNLNSYLNTYKQ